MLTQHRRPVAQASDDIGAWHQARDVAGSRPSPYSRLTPSYSPLKSLKTLVRSLGARRDCPLLNLATSRHTTSTSASASASASASPSTSTSASTSASAHASASTSTSRPLSAGARCDLAPRPRDQPCGRHLHQPQPPVALRAYGRRPAVGLYPHRARAAAAQVFRAPAGQNKAAPRLDDGSAARRQPATAPLQAQGRGAWCSLRAYRPPGRPQGAPRHAPPLGAPSRRERPHRSTNRCTSSHPPRRARPSPPRCAVSAPRS